MRIYGSATTAHLAARTGLQVRLLAWVRAKNRSTGAEEAMGLWTGDDHQVLTIDGTERLYYGAGGVLGLDPITMRSGVVVGMQTVTLSPLAPEVAQMIRGYDTRLAPVDLHRAFFEPLSGALVDVPQRIFRGWIDKVQIRTPEVGGNATVEVTLASNARALTRGLALKKSDESLRVRAPTDGFFKYADVSDAKVWWGEVMAKPPAAPAPAPTTGTAKEHGGKSN
ncbi:MAG: hypothetical protein Q8Q26_17300 [Pseudorhodobacter sp.]|nr:hypothetical protein [Pseudorhodobacter sp.]